MSGLHRIITPFLVAILLLVSACSQQPPSRFDQAQRESTSRGSSAVVKESVAGSEFNKFFPPATEGYQRIFSQEKKGFAEAKLKKDGKEVAVMSISDTINNPTAKNKFANSQKTIKGYPLVEQGTTASAVLVADRFQVKVLSRDSSFTASEREAWLAKFDLDGLSKLK